MERNNAYVLFNKVKHASLSHIAKHEPNLLEGQANFYIPLDAKKSRTEEESISQDLAQLIQTEFVGNLQNPTCLITAPSGAGKTSFTRHLVKKLWETIDTKKPQLIPLWIPLVSITQPEQDLISKHLRQNLQLSDAEIKAFKQYDLKLILVCDGFDELHLDKEKINQGRHPRLYESNHFVLDKVQLLFSCRIEVVKSIDVTLFKPSEDFKEEDLLRYEIQPLSPQKLEQFVTAYINSNKNFLNSLQSATVSHPQGRRRAMAIRSMPLTEQAVVQLENQIQTRVSLSSSTKEPSEDWLSATTYLNYLQKIPGLNEIIDNPFLLLITLQVLPKLVAKFQRYAVDRTKQWQLTRKGIYSAFLDNWFDWQIQRLERQRKYNDLVKALELFEQESYQRKTGKNAGIALANEIHDKAWVKKCLKYIITKLAKGMFQRKLNEIEWPPKNYSKSSTNLSSASNATQNLTMHWLAPFFNDGKHNPNLPLIRSCLPIVNTLTNHYSLLHKSLLEYLAAEHIFQGTLFKVAVEVGKDLDGICLVNTQETETLRFLVEQVKTSAEFEASLWEIVELSKSESKIWRAAANAATLLNLAGKSFVGKDLSGVHLGGEEGNERWGADLSGANLDSVDFSDADLRYIEFSQCCLSNAKLNRSIMVGVKFNELDETLIYSFDGKLFAWKDHAMVGKGSYQREISNSISIFSAENSKLIKKICLEDKYKGVHFRAFSPDCKQIASFYDEEYYKKYKIQLWDIDATKLLSNFKVHASMYSLASGPILYSPNSNQIAIIPPNKPNTIHLYNTSTGKCEHVLECGYKHQEITSILFSPNQNQLALVCQYGPIYLWDVSTGKNTHVLKDFSKNGKIMIAYRPNTSQLFSLSDDKIIRVWNSVNGKIEDVIEDAIEEFYNTGYTNIPLYGIAFSPDGNHFITFSNKNDLTAEIRIWTCVDYVCRKIFYTGEHITKVCYRYDAKELATVLSNGTIFIWDIVSEHFKQILPSTYNLPFLYKPNSKQFAAFITQKESIVIKDKSARGHVKKISHMFYDTQSNEFLSIGNDGSLQVWDSIAGNCKEILSFSSSYHERHTMPVVYNPNRKQLAYEVHSHYSKHKTLRLFNLKTKRIQSLTNHENRIEKITYSPCGRYLASSHSSDYNTTIWDTHIGSCLQVMPGNNAVFSPDGNQIALARNKNIVVYEIATGKILQNIDISRYGVNVNPSYNYNLFSKSFVYSPKGELFLFSYSEGRHPQKDTIFVLDALSWKLKFQFTENDITNIFFHPNGTFLAVEIITGESSFPSKTNFNIRLWNLMLEKKLLDFEPHFHRIEMLCFNSDRPKAVSFSSAKKNIQLWDVSTGKCLKDISIKINVNYLNWETIQNIFDDSNKKIILVAGSGEQSHEINFLKLDEQGNVLSKKSHWNIYAKSKLISTNICLQNVVGLNEKSLYILKSRSKKEEDYSRNYFFTGEPSSADTKIIIEFRNSQKYISIGKIIIHAKNTTLEITSKSWLLSMVRERNQGDNGHVYLILQGLDQRNYTFLKEFHLLLKGKNPGLFDLVGRGAIKIHDRAPWDLKAKQNQLIAQQWTITPEKAKELIHLIEEQQRSKAPKYSFSGKGGYNCLSWCVKQLEDIGIVVEKQSTWKSFFSFIPTDYLPDPDEITNTKKECLVM